MIGTGSRTGNSDVPRGRGRSRMCVVRVTPERKLTARLSVVEPPSVVPLVACGLHHGRAPLVCGCVVQLSPELHRKGRLYKVCVMRHTDVRVTHVRTEA